jgi:hypothetical protein
MKIKYFVGRISRSNMCSENAIEGVGEEAIPFGSGN